MEQLNLCLYDSGSKYCIDYEHIVKSAHLGYSANAIKLNSIIQCTEIPQSLLASMQS